MTCENLNHVGDVVAITNPVSHPDGFDIELIDGETATIIEGYGDGWYAIRLHQSGVVIDYHSRNLRPQ